MLTDCSQCVTGDRAFLAFLAPPPGGVLHTHIQRGLAAPDWLTGAAEYIRTYLRVRGWGGGAHELVDTKIGDQLRLQVAHRKVAVPVRDCSTMPRILSRLIIIIIIPHQGGEGGKGRKAPRSLLGILRGWSYQRPMAAAALAGWLAASGALDATAKGVVAPGPALSKPGERHSATSVLHESLLELHSTRVQGITCKHTGAIPTGLARRCDWVLMNSTNAGLIKYRSPPRCALRSANSQPPCFESPPPPSPPLPPSPAHPCPCALHQDDLRVLVHRPYGDGHHS